MIFLSIKSVLTHCLPVFAFAASYESALHRKYRHALGLTPNFGQQELRRAYRSKAQRQHPDKCSQKDATACHRKFVFLAEAYEALKERSHRTRTFSNEPRKSRPASPPPESFKVAEEYLAKREIRMAEAAERARARAAESAEALAKAMAESRRAQEEAEQKNKAEREEQQKEHNGWVKDQTDFWEKWTERQRRNKEKEEKKRLRMEAAVNSAVEKSDLDSQASVSQASNQSDKAAGALRGNSSKEQNHLPGAQRKKTRKRFSLDDALHTWSEAFGDMTHEAEL